MAKITKKASAPMSYNDSIRVDFEAIKDSEALITSGGVYQAIDDATPSTTKVDFSKWDDGQFVEWLSNNKIMIFSVTFDSSNRPIRITDNMENSMDIVW